jgi:hypothetical protein
MTKYTSYGNSSWWLKPFTTNSDFEDEFLSEKEIVSKNLYKLAANRRAISNFVSIVTSKNIPVRFSTKGDSYTDGETVTISSKITDPAEFDVAVGLALHEGSHIKLSNFKALQNLPAEISKITDYRELETLSNQKDVTFLRTIKDILNWVEDRRIDQFIYNSAPGYRDYYRAMYDKYFNDPLIDKGIQSDTLTEETIDSYMFRLINLQSKYTKLNGLKALPAISKVANLNNISRLKSTEDALVVAIDIFKLILNALPDVTNPQNQSGEGEEGEGGEGEAGEGQGGSNGEGSEGDGDENGQTQMSGDMDGDGDGDGMGSDMEADGSSNGGSYSESKTKESNSTPSGSTSKSKGGTPTELSDKQKKMLEKKIQKQKDFMNGEVKKATVTKTEQSTLDTIEQSGAETKVVGQDVTNHWGVKQNGIECILVKKMTRALMETDEFPLTNRMWDSETRSYKLHNSYQTEVEDGIRLGTILGKRLQTRSESRETIFNRQKVGRMDKRMVSSLGFGNENVFFTKEIDAYKKANLHISVDASGSMHGDKWRKTLTNVVALCKAVDMISNLNIQVTFRTTSAAELPYVVVAYDSRVDKFMKVKTLFPSLTAGGTTPEGLCFEALMKEMVATGTDSDSYFLNISDGEPYFGGRGMDYSGMPAAKHTKQMVDKITGMGIKVLSYFVAEHNMGEQSASGRVFRSCYGKAAKYINVTNVVEVTKTMNGLFMEK